MNLNKALKLKNQLLCDIKELKETISGSNSIIAGNVREFDIKTLMEEYDEKVKELVRLKTAIQKANAPVLYNIYSISEIKSTISWLKSVPSDNGKLRSRYGDAIEQVAEVVLTKKDVRDIVKKLESDISDLQDKLDVFNATTEVEF